MLSMHGQKMVEFSFTVPLLVAIVALLSKPTVCRRQILGDPCSSAGTPVNLDP